MSSNRGSVSSVSTEGAQEATEVVEDPIDKDEAAKAFAKDISKYADLQWQGKNVRLIIGLLIMLWNNYCK